MLTRIVLTGPMIGHLGPQHSNWRIPKNLDRYDLSFGLANSASTARSHRLFWIMSAVRRRLFRSVSLHEANISAFTWSVATTSGDCEAWIVDISLSSVLIKSSLSVDLTFNLVSETTSPQNEALLLNRRKSVDLTLSREKSKSPSTNSQSHHSCSQVPMHPTEALAIVRFFFGQNLRDWFPVHMG